MSSTPDQTVREAALICASLSESLLPKAPAEQQELDARYMRFKRVRAFPCQPAGSATFNQLAKEPGSQQ